MTSDERQMTLLIEFRERLEAQQGFDSVGVFDLDSFIASVGAGLRGDAGGSRNRVSQMALVVRRDAAEHDFDPRRVSPGLIYVDPIQRQISLSLLRSEIAEGFQPRRARPVSFAECVEELGPSASFDISGPGSTGDRHNNLPFVRPRLSGFRRLR